MENFDGLELVGWVSFNPESVPDLFVSIADLGRKRIDSFRSRADLVALKGNVSREFRVSLDRLFPTLIEHSFSSQDTPYQVTVSGPGDSGAEIVLFDFTGAWSLVETASAARSKTDGRVDNLDSRWIGGWAITDTAGVPKIEVVENGKVVGSGLAGLYRADVGKLFKGGLNSGFVLATPEVLCDGFPHSITVRLNSGWPFPGFPREVRFGKVIGIVEKIDKEHIEGWFGFLRSAESKTLMLTVECNGESVGATTFRATRPDIIAAGLASSAFAFRFTTKRGFFAEDLASVVDKSSGYRLRVAEAARSATLPSAFAGHLDQAADSEIVGWALDRRSPASSVRILAFVDGVPSAETVTEGFRADVQRAFPQALRPGFVLRTPEILRDGRPHQLELRVVGAARALGGTPTTVELAKRMTVLSTARDTLLDGLRSKAERITSALRSGVAARSPSGVSHIILNRNGGQVFVRCLESLTDYLDFARDELIVVDHASSDTSREALVCLEQAGLAKVLWKSRNDSFSKSNNDAAAIARCPTLLLLNNDIEFVAEISRRIERHLQTPEIGAVGIKLYDIIEPSPEDVIARSLRELRIQHLGVWFRPGHANSHYNLLGYDITTASMHREIFGLHEVAVVTGAALGIRAADFQAIGGFDETYFYGTEDIDLCLRIRQTGRRIVCDRNLEALHVRGYTRFTRRGGDASERFAGNNRHLWGKLGASMRRDYLRSRVARDGVFGPPTFRIGFAVTEAGPYAVAGDYFTALELARALAEHAGIEYVFLSEKEGWYDCNGLDALVVMRHDYDLRQVRNQHAQCLFLGWARNQFETWLRQPWMEQFDAVLSSSELFSRLIRRTTGVRAHLLYIATGFQPGPATPVPVEQDVVFVGSRWGGAREIEHALVPARIDGSVRVYGDGLEDVASFRPVWGGVLPYAEVEAKYHRSRIVVDDANTTTKRWGSPNSRVFDAIMAGTVVLTNSRATSAVLDHTLPVWTGPEDLTRQINDLLASPADLVHLAEAQFRAVEGRHTYAARAGSLLTILKRHADTALRIDVLTAVPREAKAEEWGDWHFAQALARALRRKGHAVRVRMLNDKMDRATDVVIGLRGLQRFQPTVGTINILWIISHPDLIAADELKGWQHVFVASQKLAERFAPHAASISVLEQATEFKPSSLWAARQSGPITPGVFVGNTRGVARAFIDMAAQAGLDFQIWGNGWKGGALQDRLVAPSIENRRLGTLYAAAAYVLSDHWPDMAQQGIVSNRVFDALAAGGVVITDQVEGIEELALPNLIICKSQPEVVAAADFALRVSDDERMKGAQLVASRFSFDDRAGAALQLVTRSV